MFQCHCARGSRCSITWSKLHLLNLGNHFFLTMTFCRALISNKKQITNKMQTHRNIGSKDLREKRKNNQLWKINLFKVRLERVHIFKLLHSHQSDAVSSLSRPSWPWTHHYVTGQREQHGGVQESVRGVRVQSAVDCGHQWVCSLSISQVWF